LLFACIAAAGLALTPQLGDAVPDRPNKSPWGTVRGQITWGGNVIPKQTPLKVTRDREHCLAAGPILSEDYVVNPKNKGIRWVIVFLAPEGQKALPIHPDLKKPKSDKVSLTIKPGRFAPHVLLLRQEQSLRVTNPGPIAYNAQWCGMGPRAQSGNVLIPAGREHVIGHLKPERLFIWMRDAIHPWMKAWIKVFDHPYYAVTDVDGKFTIPKAPAGKYRLVTWQESLGWGPGGKAGVAVEIQRGAGGVVKLKMMPLEY
jgi:hypothetical protein